MVRHAGAAPAFSVWKTDVLLLHQWRMRNECGGCGRYRADVLLVFSEALICLSYTAMNE